MRMQHSAISVQRSAIGAMFMVSRRAFSLVEVLLAIFILGIGVISIAALFPAGIAQQRLSVDDMSGAAVVNSAMDIIRSKVKAEDFGTFDEFDDPSTSPAFPLPPRPTVPGDWSWLRPAVLMDDDPNTTTSIPGNSTTPPPYIDTGAIDIFSWYRVSQGGNAPVRSAMEFPSGVPDSQPRLFGVPYSRAKYGNVPPRIIINQEERYYPMTGRMYTKSIEAARPQFVWDCAFRRFGGRILVSIFVYRVSIPGGGTAPNYRVAVDGNSGLTPPLPVWLNLVRDPASHSSPPEYAAGGAWDSGYGLQAPADSANRAIVLGTRAGTRYNVEDARQAWQNPRQWLIDQNNNVHRVVGQSRLDYDTSAGDVNVELTRSVIPVMGWKKNGMVLQAGPTRPTFSQYYYEQPNAVNLPLIAPYNDWVHDDVVTDIWYIPMTDPNGITLTPVYAAVKEL